MSAARFVGDRNRVPKSYKARLMGELKIPTTMSDSFSLNPAGALFLASPSPTIPAPDHVPDPFPMSVPSSPRLPVVHLPPTLATSLPSTSPASLPTNLTCLEKRALRAHRSLTRSGSESSGEVKSGGRGEVEGLINMTEPWIEGPKSAKVSDN